MDRKFLEDLAYSAQRTVDSPQLEVVICTENDVSLISPGVPVHYYRFLYRLAQTMKPKLSLELGTYTGISAACLAEGNPEGKVITVDNIAQLRDDCRRANVEYIIQDSLILVNLPGPIDILFIDTYHDGVRTLAEYNLYKNLMNENGIIFFDDIFLLDCMRKFWSEFAPEEGEKFEIPVHGGAGFGVVLLRPSEA